MLFVRVCQSLTDTTQWFYGTGFTTPSNEYVACDSGHRDRHCGCLAGCTAGERLDGWTAAARSSMVQLLRPLKSHGPWGFCRGAGAEGLRPRAFLGLRYPSASARFKRSLVLSASHLVLLLEMQVLVHGERQELQG